MNTVIILVVAFMVFFAFTYFCQCLKELRRRRKHEYDLKYNRIQHLIYDCQVCNENYHWIMSLLERLGNLKYKNRKMTEVLTMEFLKKFKAINN